MRSFNLNFLSTKATSIKTFAVAALIVISLNPKEIAAFGCPFNKPKNRIAVTRPFITSLHSRSHRSSVLPSSFGDKAIDTQKMSNTISASLSGNSFAQFPCLNSNYGYLIHDENTGETVAIDTPDAKAYAKELDKRGWKLTHILNTHYHDDHTGGNIELKERFENVKIYGPAAESDKIPGIDVGLRGGDRVAFGRTEADVIDVGGHTKGHIAFYFSKRGEVYVGDAMFSLGCGKMFEGTPQQFWSSLERLRSLPDDTKVYCAHEITEINAKFALHIEPKNQDLQRRVKEVTEKRSRGEPTVPSILGEEKKTNPFLRVDVSAEIRQNAGAKEGDMPADVFAKVRHAKDVF